MTTRILYVITKANWGGAQRYVFDLAVSARKEGNDVLVVSGNEGELTERLRNAGVDVVSILSLKRDIHIFSELRAFRTLLSVMRNFSPHIVHGNSSKAGALASLAGRICNVPRIIFTAHGWAFNEDRPWWQKKIIVLFHWITIILSHKTICVSEALAQDIEHMPFVRNKLIVVHNGIDPQPLLSRNDARAYLAPQIHASFWIGTIAELHPVKQIDVLIRAFVPIAKMYADVALILIGGGEERKRLEELVRQEGLVSRIHFCGHVREASTYLSSLDIFVFPSRSEALGYALLEAGNASLPVVASKVGGIPEIITNHENGILVPPGNVSALTEALTLLIENDALRAKLGRALCERVTRVFSKEQMVRETLSIY